MGHVDGDDDDHSIVWSAAFEGVSPYEVGGSTVTEAADSRSPLDAVVPTWVSKKTLMYLLRGPNAGISPTETHVYHRRFSEIGEGEELELDEVRASSPIPTEAIATPPPNGNTRATTMDIHSSKSAFKGILWKKKKIMGKFVSRVFVMNAPRSRLDYYEDFRLSKLLGSIDLRGVRWVEWTPHPQKTKDSLGFADGQYILNLATSTHAYTFVAESEHEVKMWVSLIKALPKSI